MADKNKEHIVKHDDNPGVADHVGEAAGGISGVLAGAAIGSAAGPVGTLIGGIAGAVGGWWTGRTVAEAATHVTNDDDTYYRTHYERSPNRLADRNYEDVRPAYHLGHIAAHNPDYRDRDWDYVENDLRRGWGADVSNKYGAWDRVRDYAREGYTRGRSGLAGAATKTANAADNLKDRVDGNPASRPGPDPTDRRF